MTMTTILRYMSRNDPNGEYDDAIAIAEDTDTAKQAEVAREVMTILDRWMISAMTRCCAVSLSKCSRSAIAMQQSVNARIRFSY